MKNILSILLLAVLSPVVAATASASSSDGIGIRPGVYYGRKVGIRHLNPCAGRSNYICAVIKYDLSTGGDRKSVESPDGVSAVSSAPSAPKIVWIIPANFPEEEFRKAKAQEHLFDNLRVVRASDEDNLENARR